MPPQKKPFQEAKAKPPQKEPLTAPPNEDQEAPQTEPITAVTASSSQTEAKPTTTPPKEAHTASRTPSNWYIDTLRTIVNRALDADKPDIKGALAALTMLAEAEEPAESTGDIATLLRDARKRAAHARENTD